MHTQLVAFTRHAITVPAALRYGTFRVSTYGARTVSGYPDIGFVFYESSNTDISDYGAVLSAGEGWHNGDTVSGEDFITPSRSFRWWAGTAHRNWYDIRSFKVTYAYYVLV